MPCVCVWVGVKVGNSKPEPSLHMNLPPPFCIKLGFFVRVVTAGGSGCGGRSDSSRETSPGVSTSNASVRGTEERGPNTF